MTWVGKRVVITGAGGIHGAWIAEAFARAGASLLLSDVNPVVLAKTASRLPDRDSILMHNAELTDPVSITSLVGMVEQVWGAADILINNAAIYPNGSLLDLPLVDWDRIMSINLRAPFLLARELARLMIAHGVEGSIINISSGAARQVKAGTVAYSVSKAGLQMLTKGLALELAIHGIRVNAIEPGFAPGSLTSPLAPDYIKNRIAVIPLGRTSGANDASAAVLFLTSPEASYVTGAVLAVDGGASIGSMPGPLGHREKTVGKLRSASRNRRQ